MKRTTGGYPDGRPGAQGESAAPPTIFIALLLLLLTGCASSHREMVKVKEVRSIVVAWNKSVPEVCGPKLASEGYSIHGCAVVWRDQLCTITMLEDSPDWVIAHEFRHCFGYAHR